MMSKCECKKEPKVIKRVVNDFTLSATENGYVVRVGKPKKGGDDAVTSGFTFSLNRGSADTIYEGPTEGQRFVFPDFASLSAWMRANLKHGKPARK
jgi:hypothetical protein